MTYIVCNDVYDLFNLQSNLNGILTYAQNLLLHKVHCSYNYNPCVYSYMNLETPLSIIHWYLHGGSMHGFSASVSMLGFHLL